LNRATLAAALALILALTVALLAGCSPHHDRAAAPDGESGEYRSEFAVDKATLASTGTGPYWSLQPGRVWEYRSDDGDTLTISVLDQTQVVDGVTTRVVEERETEHAQLAEVSRNYFAADPATGDLYYFGEDVDIYEHARVTGHPGSWRSGVGGARFGLALPGKPSVGMRYFQELAPGTAMDRAEVTTVSGSQTVPAGRWDGCLGVRESSPLEPGSELKWYAPGVGLIVDDQMKLVRVFGP
jgi:hypothetical protein